VHGENADYWRGYSRKDLAGPSRANNLLQRLAIEDACDAGCRYYSMGGSGVVPLSSGSSRRWVPSLATASNAGLNGFRYHVWSSSSVRPNRSGPYVS